MRILHVIQELHAGGAERVVVALVRGSRRQGHDVAVAAAPGMLEHDLEAPVYPLPPVRRRLSRLPAAARAVARARRAFRAEIVHAHNPSMAAAASLATRRGRSTTAVATVHGVPDEDYARATQVLRLAGLPVVACGPGVAAALEEHGCRVSATIVNGIAPPPEAADRDALERELGIQAATPLLLSVGRLVEQKNHGLAIHALARIAGAVLLIVGEGPLRAALERESANVGVADRTIFAGARSDARAMIGAADVLLLTSHWEGLPLVALEALAVGTPVVATAVRGTRELLTNEEDSLLVPDDDVEAFAEAILRVLSDRTLQSSLRATGLRLAASYSEEAMVTRVLQLYETLMRTASPGRALLTHDGRRH